jgi:hypothetical protein
VSRDVKFDENLASVKSHEFPRVAEDEEEEATKGEQRSEASNSGSQPSGGEELAPSSSVRRPRWFEHTLKDAQEHVEAPRSIVSESRPPKKFPNFMALRNNIIEEAVDHRVYQDAMVQDDV